MPSTPDYTERLNSYPFLPGFDSYLSNFANHSAALPLWSTRNMFKEFFQVEVLAEIDVPFEKSAGKKM